MKRNESPNSGSGTILSEINEHLYGIDAINGVVVGLINADDNRPDGESRKHCYQISGLLTAQRILIGRVQLAIGDL